MNSIRLYFGEQHQCSYLPDRNAQSVFVDPRIRLDGHLYSHLAEQGFRRSGGSVYRPRCSGCDACVPVRIRVTSFTPSRSQMRVIRRNQDIRVDAHNAGFSEEHYRLFTTYLQQRHAHGGMADSTREDYMEFLIRSWLDTKLVEFRLEEELVAIAVTDYLDDGLSAVYTFFKPEDADRSLGTLAILWQIHEAKKLGLNFVYLGFWIEECQKMSYKNLFRPLEALISGRWQQFEKGEKIQR